MGDVGRSLSNLGSSFTYVVLAGAEAAFPSAFCADRDGAPDVRCSMHSFVCMPTRLPGGRCRYGAERQSNERFDERSAWFEVHTSGARPPTEDAQQQRSSSDMVGVRTEYVNYILL